MMRCSGRDVVGCQPLEEPCDPFKWIVHEESVKCVDRAYPVDQEKGDQ
jgi:hypothetical protein